jgi:hypothetical protein
MKIIGIAFLLTCCSYTHPMIENFNRVGYQTAKKIEKACPLECDSIGRTVLDDKIAVYEVTFDYVDPLTIDEARYLIIKAANISVSSFQKDQSIQEFLRDSPFKTENLAIFIFTKNFDKITPNPGFITEASLVADHISYKLYDLHSKKFITLYEETYEEALQKCQ